MTAISSVQAAASRTDTERIDFLEKFGDSIGFEKDGEGVRGNCSPFPTGPYVGLDYRSPLTGGDCTVEKRTLREAIDSAIDFHKDCGCQTASKEPTR